MSIYKEWVRSRLGERWKKAKVKADKKRAMFPKTCLLYREQFRDNVLPYMVVCAAKELDRAITLELLAMKAYIKYDMENF